ncbi:MAG: hypothetical protein HYV03_00530 [Deltaproteobacteria bacterium]|nr:hypothetical protein [Deltaproteobacteria bacterium]
MRIRFLSSYDSGYRKLPPPERGRVQQAVDVAIDYLTSSAIPPKGLGLKKLRPPFWEVRVGRGTRILFTLEGDLLQFVLVGDHNDIISYLRRR